MSRKILLIGAALSRNFGGPSLLMSTRRALEPFFPGAEYTLRRPPGSLESDELIAPRYGVKVTFRNFGKGMMLMALFKRLTGVLRGPASARSTIKLFDSADVVIDIWGICFADSLGANTFRKRASEGIHFILAKIFRKPVVKYTASLGPFSCRWNRFFARLYFQHFVDLILARDETSKRCLKGLGVRTKIRVCPDTAFLLEPCESEASRRWAAIRRQHPVVGLSVSFKARNCAPDPRAYISAMANFVRHAINKVGACVAILPNSLSDGLDDDDRVAEDIWAEVADDRAEVLYTEGWLAQETKGVIQQCEVVVAARYHTVVAALSLGIPTLVIGWHHKYAGVLGLFGQERWVIDIENLSTDALIKKFEDLWEDRVKIRSAITAALPEVRRRIYAGAREVHNLVAAAGLSDT